jgi:hypothetical protein
MRMVGIDMTTGSLPRGDRRRSEPVHIREVIAEVWAVLETCLEEARKEPRAEPAAARPPQPVP